MKHLSVAPPPPQRKMRKLLPLDWNRGRQAVYPKKLSSMPMEDLVTDNISANIVDVEVTAMVDNHASLKMDQEGGQSNS